MNRLGSIFLGVFFILCMQGAHGESFVIPKKESKKTNKTKKRSALREDIARACRQLLHESARIINRASIVNDFAGNCAADMIDGGECAMCKPQELQKLADQINAALDDMHIIKERIEKINRSLVEKTAL